MPFERLQVLEQQSLLTRLAAKKLTRTSIQSTEDLVVKAGKEIVLSSDRTSDMKPVVRKPAGLQEIRSWLGHPESVLGRSEVKRIHAARLRQVERAISTSKLDTVRPRAPKSFLQSIAGDPAKQAAFELVAHAAVEGIFEVSRFKPMEKAITDLVAAVSIFNWAFVNVTIKAGGQLVFGPPGPHTLVAHTLTIEPGGKIVVNNCQLTLDCHNIVVQ